ncbi:MAG: prolyl oligopeptidase family serine peptidase [Gemmatimonadaceae bacterium]
MMATRVPRANLRRAVAFVLCAFAAHAARAQSGGAPLASFAYPSTPRGNQVDDIGGTHVADPYRWLESASPAVRTWLAAENAVTDAYLAQSTRRQDVLKRLTNAWNTPRISAPFTAGDRLFFYENGGLDNQPTLYVRERPESPARVLIDPNAFSADGLIAIVDQAPSPEGRYLAYSVSTLGSGERTVRVRDVKTAQDLSDELHNVKDSTFAWTKDERGFFYVWADPSSAAATPARRVARQIVRYHRLGRPQSDDQTIYENTDRPDWSYGIHVSGDGQYLLVEARTGTELHNRLYLIDLDNPGRPNLRAPLVKLFDTDDALYQFVANDGPVFYLRTSNGATRGRLVAVDINTPDPNRWTTVLRETYDPLVDVIRVGDRFVAHRLHDAHSVLELYAIDGGPRGVVQLPGVGTVSELHPHPEDRDFYFTFTTFLFPQAPFRYDLDGRNLVSYGDARADTALARYETTQLFFTSKDGTRVPMFITARRGITLDGTHATLLTGGGGFNASMTPAFSPDVATWLDLGGIYAVANVRGGGEYGRAWHDAAIGGKKQVAVDDFIAAADFLISQRYTRPSLLAVTGRGHAGMLVAAAMTQRPKLFGAAVIDDGLFDMARFTRFDGGASWTPEYGSPDRPADLRALLAYSPLHAVEPGVVYPPTLLTAGDHDDVIPAANSYKLAASLQRAGGPSGVALLRVDFDAGFGPGLPTTKLLALDADRLTFLTIALRLAR